MSTCNIYADARAFVDDFNERYAQKHEAFENQFWGTKMALKQGEFSTELLNQTKKDLEDLLSDPEILLKAKSLRKDLETLKDSNDGDDVLAGGDVAKILDVIIRTCQCNEYPTPEAKAVREQTNEIEGILQKSRNEMNLGYVDSNGEFKGASSVGLRTVMRTNSDESVRKSAYEALRSIGKFVCEEGFLDIVKLRNKLAKMLGYQDYYDYTVTNAEGFGKDKLFEILDGLEEGTRPLMVKAMQDLETLHGKEALDPWNMGYMMSGNVIKKMDPYFPFSKSVENYIRSYAAMNINYCNSTMTLDLLDRKNKYSNGFCHWPVPAWIKSDGTFVPSKTNFTSLADPAAVGSGLTALNTLMHEAGHAAHFANIKQPSPLFSQERAPTSVAYAENQSMFLDSLVEDAAWRAKYARDVNGNPLPFDIHEESIRSTHPFKVFQLRGMLSVSYFEKALYELPDDEVTSERVQSLADEIEIKIQGGLNPRPLLSVPHLVSDEASCYYQGYTVSDDEKAYIGAGSLARGLFAQTKQLPD
jgi:oligoendopeptidase F